MIEETEDQSQMKLNQSNMGENHYSQRRRTAGGSLEGPSPERLVPAIATEEVRVFRLEKRNKAESIVANGGLLPMPSQRVLFMGRVKRRDWVKRQKMDRRIQIMWMKNEEPGAKKSFFSSGLSVPCAWGTRSCSECWLERWCIGLIII